MPGALWDPFFLFLAFSVAISVFILAEQLRMAGVPPYGVLLNNFALNFIDAPDSGTMVTTHMYLLIGCATPIWMFLSPETLDPDFSFDGLGAQKMAVLISGTVVLGVGDTAASIVGKKCGSVRWPDSMKTIEGTLAAIIATVAATELFLVMGGFSHQSHSVLLLSALLVCILEATTEQVDNLFLPLYFSAALSIGM